MIILGIVFYSARVDAADTKDVVAGLIIGGIIGSEIEKNSNRDTVVVYPSNPRIPYSASSVRVYPSNRHVQYCQIPMDTIYVPNKRDFDPRRDSLYLGEWHWSEHEQAWIRDNR